MSNKQTTDTYATLADLLREVYTVNTSLIYKSNPFDSLIWDTPKDLWPAINAYCDNHPTVSKRYARRIVLESLSEVERIVLGVSNE